MCASFQQSLSFPTPHVQNQYPPASLFLTYKINTLVPSHLLRTITTLSCPLIKDGTYTFHDPFLPRTYSQ